jgi:hypothetical protein
MIMGQSMRGAFLVLLTLACADPPDSADDGIQLELAVVLTDSAGVAGIAPYPVLVRSRSGEFLLVDGLHRSRIAVFGSHGQLIRTVGTAGEGPGEFDYIQIIQVDTTGQLHVFDHGNARHTTLSPSFDVLSIRSVPLVMAYVALLRGDTLAATNAVLMGAGGCRDLGRGWQPHTHDSGGNP